MRIQRRRIDRDRIVAHTKLALETLLYEWPEEESPSRRRAIKACLMVVRGERPPSFARRAFVAAAQSAGILLEE